MCYPFRSYLHHPFWWPLTFLKSRQEPSKYSTFSWSYGHTINDNFEMELFLLDVVLELIWGHKRRLSRNDSVARLNFKTCKAGFAETFELYLDGYCFVAVSESVMVGKRNMVRVYSIFEQSSHILMQISHRGRNVPTFVINNFREQWQLNIFDGVLVVAHVDPYEALLYLDFKSFLDTALLLDDLLTGIHLRNTGAFTSLPFESPAVIWTLKVALLVYPTFR